LSLCKGVWVFLIEGATKIVLTGNSQNNKGGLNKLVLSKTGGWGLQCDPREVGLDGGEFHFLTRYGALLGSRMGTERLSSRCENWCPG